MCRQGRNAVTSTYKAMLKLAAVMSSELAVNVVDYKAVSEE